MTSNQSINQKFNDVCPNCKNQLISRRSMYLGKLIYYDCNDCNISVEVRESSQYIYYNKYHIYINLAFNETVITSPQNYFYIKDVPLLLDTQSVLNFIALAKTFQ